MSLFYPIFNDDPIFGNKLIKTSCPGRIDICANLPGTSVLDTFVIPNCNNINFKFSLNPDESPNGCCVVDTSNDTCDTYNTSISDESSEFTGTDYDIGIQFLDATNLNPRKICHSAPIRKRVIKIQEFFVIILLSAALIITTAIFGSCYEFWLKYGNGNTYIDGCSLNYQNKCSTDKKKSPIEYAFPSNIEDYPYINCPIQGNTSDFMFPYNIINNFNIESVSESFGYKWLKILGLPIKSFCLNFLYTMLFSRIALSYLLTGLSNGYKTLGNSPFLKNILFLLLTGILFNLIANYTGIYGLNGGPGLVLTILSIVIVFAMLLTLVMTNFVLYWFPGYYNKFQTIKKSQEDYILSDNYKLFSNIFYKLGDTEKTTSCIPTSYKDIKFINILRNIGLFLLVLIPFLISISTGLIGSMVGALYMMLSMLWNIFYIPLSNTKCFLTIIKDHGELLTILFCISILISSLKQFNSTTSGTIGGLVGLLILYKIIKNM